MKHKSLFTKIRFVRYLIFGLWSLVFVTACSNHDPVLPGARESVFPNSAPTIMGKPVPNLPDAAPEREISDCPYTQDSSNTVRLGDKKIFSGYPTNNSVKSNQKPVCGGNYVYAGLTTGELVKINFKTRNIEWIADIYRQNNLIGGATVLDIVAPIIMDGNHLYAGGIGDAFCKLRAKDGKKIWCLDIGVATPFLVIDRVAFLVGTNNTLYAINTDNGDIYWGAEIKYPTAPAYADKAIIVGKEKFDAATGGKINN
ncbi:MAG: PQQ-like beta-propeller repeat protein [Rickettsiales bacterium]|jgi:outer membrane protein assembly factor BamB|nr:PQQ-like beta-propeller repeat protein [Rickettsiales bacterium]